MLVCIAKAVKKLTSYVIVNLLVLRFHRFDTPLDAD